MQYTMSYNWDTDDFQVFDIVFCPGKGNPTFASADELLSAYQAGTLNMCSVDTDFYGDTKAHMTPEGPYYIPEEMAARMSPMVIMPEGPRFTVSGNTIEWMGWDFHIGINAMHGIHISNLRFKQERIAYEIYAADFTAVYSGASTRTGRSFPRRCDDTNRAGCVRSTA